MDQRIGRQVEQVDFRNHAILGLTCADDWLFSDRGEEIVVFFRDVLYLPTWLDQLGSFNVYSTYSQAHT